MRAERIPGRAKANVLREDRVGAGSRWICPEQRLFLGNREQLRVERLAGYAWDIDLPKQFFIPPSLNPDHPVLLAVPKEPNTSGVQLPVCVGGGGGCPVLSSKVSWQGSRGLSELGDLASGYGLGEWLSEPDLSCFSVGFLYSTVFLRWCLKSL